MKGEVVSLRVRDGKLTDTGSWLYVWLRPGQDRPVIYVGGTGLPPAVRTWLHLHDPDPDVGRVAARYPDVSTESLDVLAFELPPPVPRAAAKAVVIYRLHAQDLLSDRYVGDAAVAVGVADELAEVIDAVIAEVGRRAGRSR